MEGIGTALGNGSTALTLILIVVGLAVALVLLFWIFRKIAGIGGIGSGRNKQPRLAVLDAAHVDGKRRLVLVRRDDVEHLVLIGGASDVLIEGNIDPATVPVVRHQEQRSRRRSRGNKVEVSERPENTDVGMVAAGVGAGAAAIAATQYADQAESEPVEESPPPAMEQAIFEPGNDETVQETVTEEFVTHAETLAEPDLGQAPPPSSILEEELESALQTDEKAPDPFSELESELASVTPELESLDDTLAPVESDSVPMDPPLSEDAPDDLPEELPEVLVEDLAEAPQVEITESIAAELSADEPLAPEVGVDSDSEQQSDKAQKQPLSKNQNVEDEMQRLLDELANS